MIISLITIFHQPLQGFFGFDRIGSFVIENKIVVTCVVGALALYEGGYYFYKKNFCHFKRMDFCSSSIKKIEIKAPKSAVILFYCSNISKGVSVQKKWFGLKPGVGFNAEINSNSLEINEDNEKSGAYDIYLPAGMHNTLLQINTYSFTTKTNNNY